MPAELPFPALHTTRILANPNQLIRAGSRSPARQARLSVNWLLMLLFLLLSGTTTTVFAQGTTPPECAADEKFANTWYFGFKAGLDFNQASADSLPKVLTNGAMDAPAGSGVMSDRNGAILFYSNGETVWNGDGTVMTNGTGLAGNRFTTDGPLPIRMPGIPSAGQPTRYLLFTLNSTVGLSYSEIEIPAGGGPGTVIAATKNTPLARGTAEKITGVFHKNGCDIWVITHGWGDAKLGNDNRGDAFLAYRVRPAVNYIGPVLIDAPVVSTVGSVHALSPTNTQGYRGQMKVTPDGQRLALARYSEAVGDSSSTVELFGFNTNTGRVSVNPQVPFIVDSGAGKYYGVSFSPGRYLYATVRNPAKLLQFNISGTGPVTRQDIPLKTPADLGSMQAAPDGKIYVARDNQPALGFIPFPDSLGAKIRYADDSLQLRGGRLSGLGLVNFNQSSLLRVGPSFDITGCRQITFTAPPISFFGKIYTWTFGDGTRTTRSATDSVITHTYATPGNYTVTLRIETECFCRESSGGIQVPDLPVPGSISAPQTVCAGTAPATLTSTVDASSDASLPLTYQWESSTDNTNFTAISGATGPTYTPPNSLPAGTTYFRRRVQLLLPNLSGPYCTPTFTASVAITVLPALAAGSIAADQTVCVGSTPAPLTSTAAPTGGTGTFAYQWESSTDNVTWTAVAGATTETLAPGPLPVTTSFRRQVTSGPCNRVSGTVTITVLPALAAGRIAADQTLCAGGAPASFTSETPATGGTSTIVYQWETSTDNVTWTAIVGATGPTYASGALTATTYFRRQASSGSSCAPALSNVVTITVQPALVAGSIAADQTVCAGSPVAPLTSTAPATGGTGTFVYQWESSLNNANWTIIAGATGETLAPGPLTTTTFFRRQVSSGECAITPSNLVTITVLPALAAGSIATDQAICAGSAPAPFTSTSEASGTSNIVYQWELSTDNATWTPIVGAIGPAYGSGPLTTTTYFRRQASSSGACASVLSNVITVTVTPALVAGSIGTDQTLCPGATPSPLTSTAPATGGTGTITYQWESSLNNANWAVITGATGSTYAPGPLSATTYFRRVVTSGPCGPLYSPTVVLTVLPTLVAGSIAADQIVCAGGPVAPLTSTAPATGGTGTFAYQWESSTDNVTWTAVAGATTETFAPGPLPVTTSFRRQTTSGSCGPVYTSAVTVTVLPALTAGSIAANQALCPGATPSPLTSTAPATGGTGTFSYQWESSADNTTWAAIGGATGETLTLGPALATRYYRRQVTAGTCAPAVSNVVTITVAPPLTAGTIAADQTVCRGVAPSALTSTVGAGGGTGNYSYQWESSGNNAGWVIITGATGADYAPGPLTTTTYFRRRVSSGECGPEYSPSVVLTVLPELVVGSITAEQDICAGATPTPLSGGGASGGTGTFVYQWESSTDNANWTAIAGATDPTFAPGALTVTTYFRRRVTSGTGTCSTGVSNVVPVRVQPVVTPTVTLAAPPVECPGTALTFTAVPTNVGAAPTFRWLVNNVAVASGPTFTSSTLVSGDQVRVEVTPTAGLCSTGPASATVTVTRTPVPAPTLTIAVQPGGPVCLGAPLTFSLTGVTEAGPAPAYQWQVNGNDVAGATGPVFTSTTLREGQTVTLRLRTTNVCAQPATAVSNGVAVRIQPPVDVDAGPDKEILAGTSVTLEGRADGTYPVRWTTTSGQPIPGNERLQLLVSPTVTTTYTLSAGEGGCADSDQVTVTVRPPIRIPNAFTPNGDGRDDTWQIEFIEQFPDNTVTVFNRWGNKVFSANNYSRANEWRGDINGQPAPVGTYYYVVVTKGPLGRSYSGSLTVLY
ncbi:gliding motility-associated C-terminal domain-containing protein (plasmid) [Hymenobacter tibetensis]|uniref:Gliding motility-associated C-terminal domain-containing protein n=1 Tax=Hymenobacter tibetensis TaxID=497967 RepID=A0ABY4DBL2_9BACT|nr:gliding motility-associated C-terminal domain-containing protein [Hymenobacter tibetensis]UOG77483.1 gliding motility-associated C-terminal domain-containing protein [Hymenobacter tibetensis]